MKVALRALIALSLIFGVTFSYAEDTTPSLTETKFVDVLADKFLKKELHCLAQNIYYEAGSESFEGKVAVAQVSINRAESGKFPETLCGVVNQKTQISPQKIVCQFSWVCEGKRLKTAIGDRWEEALAVARMVLFEGYRLPKLENALYFHAVHVNPNWGKPKVAKIGNHVFYKDPQPKQQSF